ncbi:DUF484 domain-containing protein [Budviciaceae bacterium CWB-B4]|uniref:DUF484 domain-containing protein n=1 Tax=Limnobaculum xujianqingii TaxID=2738837 RepID=A0A9D7AL90_9GAMM|nr:DUF484 domain-containing protein [Limnobaculum xujianqingii]MBK5074916.1 DUF484 domain-containing protein [Limnobaculum xujianqingii]MBK5178208.1 DUF484 domain-containing protein [Limnobaculum xujianqingii]
MSQRKKKGSTSETPPVSLTDDMVSQYLLNNPDFFIRNARQIEQMRVPHPVRDSISLVEWQMGRQRNHIEQLEEEITLLMEQATTNEILFTRLINLQCQLVQADSLQDLLDRLRQWARSLGLVDATIRLFNEKWHLGAPSDFTHLSLPRQSFESMRIQRLGSRNQYLGPLNGPEILLLMPEAKMVGSVALSLLGKRGDLGMVIFTSRDPQHYQQGMGTLILDQLSLILPGLLSRWIEPV